MMCKMKSCKQDDADKPPSITLEKILEQENHFGPNLKIW